MLEVDENLIRAVERLIDGGRNHHWYGTIARYRKAAKAGDVKAFRDSELLLRSDLLSGTRSLVPERYAAAVAALCEAVNSSPVPCEDCEAPKLHGQRCPGPGGRKSCTALRDACGDCGGLCCHCAHEARHPKE